MSELETMEIEKQSQMTLMQRSVAGLKANIELTNIVTANKVNSHMKDNKQLLNEVNVLRHEMRSVLLENSQLKNRVEFHDARVKSRENQEMHSETMRQMGNVNSRVIGGNGHGNNAGSSNSSMSLIESVLQEEEHHYHKPNNTNTNKGMDMGYNSEYSQVYGDNGNTNTTNTNS